MRPKKTRLPTAANKPIKSVGILGGGQLSKMLCDSALKLNLEPLPFCFSNDDPATKSSKNFMVGNLNDEHALGAFFSRVDVVTYESDFLPFNLLKKFDAVRFMPELKCLELLRDKIRQKELLKSLKIPTPKFNKFLGGDLKEWISSAAANFGGEAVFKWVREGYDGKGVLIFDGNLDRAYDFCRQAVERGVGVFSEQKIVFKRELALVTVLSVSGKFEFYPLVVSEQSDGICRRVFGPASSLGVEDRLERLARDYAEKIGRKLNLCGVFAIEYFEDQEGALLINELAPRVHNAGHFTMDASTTSQFENHWRGILDWPLGRTKSAMGFAMLNLLGAKGRVRGDPAQVGLPPGFYLHWYGKRESREGRKMGHINLVSSSVEELKAKLSELDRLGREWLSKFES